MQVDIKFKSNEKELHGKLDIISKTAPIVIFFPGVSGGALTDRYNFLYDAVLAAGANFFRFNFSAQEDGCPLDNSNLQEELVDIKNTIDHLETLGYNLKKFGVVAKSFGCIKVFLLNDPRISCVILLSPTCFFNDKPNTPDVLFRKYADISKPQEIILDAQLLRKWSTPTLIFLGSEDALLNPLDMKKQFETLSAKKEILFLEGATHSLDRPHDITQIKEKVTFFLKKFMLK